MKQSSLILLLLMLNIRWARATGPDNTDWKLIHRSERSLEIGSDQITCRSWKRSDGKSFFKIVLNIETFPSNQVITFNSVFQDHCPVFTENFFKAKLEFFLYHEIPVDSSGKPTGEEAFYNCMSVVTFENGTRMPSKYWLPLSPNDCK